MRNNSPVGRAGVVSLIVRPTPAETVTRRQRGRFDIFVPVVESRRRWKAPFSSLAARFKGLSREGCRRRSPASRRRCRQIPRCLQPQQRLRDGNRLVASWRRTATSQCQRRESPCNKRGKGFAKSVTPTLGALPTSVAAIVEMRSFDSHVAIVKAPEGGPLASKSIRLRGTPIGSLDASTNLCQELGNKACRAHSLWRFRRLRAENRTLQLCDDSTVGAYTPGGDRSRGRSASDSTAPGGGCVR